MTELMVLVAEPAAVALVIVPALLREPVEKMKLAGRSTVRFYRKHPHFAVMANLGMTPVSLGVHSALTKLPWLLGYFDKRAARSKFARDLVQQYYYVSGIKNALQEKEYQRG